MQVSTRLDSEDDYRALVKAAKEEAQDGPLAVWDAAAMSSGVYFARLQAGGKVMTVKLLLIK